MSESLIVRLSSEQHSAIPWVVWSTQQNEVIASGEIPHWDHLDELKEYAQQRPVIALIGGQNLVLSEVEVPAGGARQFETMLPFLMEEDIAQDVDDLHFSILSKSGDKAQVCAIDKAWLKSVMEAYSQQEMPIRRVMPDVLAMPLAESGSSAAQLGEQWLIRHSEHQGVVVESSWLDLYSSAHKQSHEGWTVECYSALPENADDAWQAKPAEMTMALLAQQATKSSINLLSGEFKPKSSWGKHWKIWQKAAIAACVLLVVLVAQQLLKVHQYEAQAQAYRAESERIFRQVLPGKRKIPTVSYLKRQMTDEENRLSGGGSADSMLPWLGSLSGGLKQVKSIEITSFKYDSQRGEVRIQARSNDFQPFEQARVKLEENFQVEQGQLNRNGTQVTGSFVLKRQ